MHSSSHLISVVALLVIAAVLAVPHHAGVAAANFNWESGVCSTAGQVYSTKSHSCIANPCTSGVFDPASETCVCPTGFILDPPDALPSTSPTCISCSAMSQMQSRSNPPMCLPCGENVLTTPSTVAFKNLFLDTAASGTVTIDGAAWTYGGGDVLAKDPPVTAAKVSIVAAQWNTTSLQCGCPNGFILTNTLTTGVNLKSFICTRCVNATNATVAGVIDPYSCQVCGGGSAFDVTTSQCSCVASNGALILRQAKDGDNYCASLTLQSSVLFGGSTGTTLLAPVNVDNSGRDGNGDSSYVLSQYANSAAMGCASKNATACQQLANLCALALYKSDSIGCSLYTRLHQLEGCIGVSSCEQPTTLPWLSYLRSSSAVFQDTVVKMKVSLRTVQDHVHYLRFVVFEYDAMGALLGRRVLTDQLSLCDINTAFVRDFFYVGRKNSVACNLNIRYYLQQAQLDNATKIYELFLEDSDGTLVPIPVVIDTSTGTIAPSSVDDRVIFRDASTTQVPVAGAWRRRFFLVDNLASRNSATGLPRHITYARRVSLMVHLRGSADAANIYVPVLTVQYASSLVSGALLAGTNFNSGELVHLETNNSQPGSNAFDAPSAGFRVYYIRSDDEIIQAFKPTVIVLCCLAFITSFLKTYGWMRRQQDLMLGMGAVIRWFIFLCNHFANIMAVFVFLSAGAFYVFFKHQAPVKWLLPVNADYVWGCLYAAVGAKLLVVIFYIVEQCNADYFVIDWERPKTSTADEGPSNPGVSMWRSTFVANELNEMQTRRAFHVLLVILIVIVFLEGLEYNKLALSIPNAELTVQAPHIVMEPLLRVAVGAFFWMIVSLVIYVLEFLIYYKVVSPHPLQAFADLCSVSNISLMILLEPQWGFYIHGESLHPFSDCSMEEFQSNLHREAQGNLPARGLGGVQECQTFEVFIGAYLRHFLYVCYNQLFVEHDKALNGEVGPVNAGHHRRCFEFLCGGAGKPRVFTPETLSIKGQINGMMQQSVRNAEKNLLNKFGLHAIMDFPPNIVYMNGPFAGERAGTDLFFIDSPTNYDAAFLSGLDFDLFILYGLLYCTIDSIHLNSFWAMLAVYLVDVALVWYRDKEGTANLGSKTLFDDRFFL